MFVLLTPQPTKETESRCGSAYIRSVSQVPSESYTVSTGSEFIQFQPSSPAMETHPIPQSFVDALADFDAGRVVDAEIALNEPPSNA